MRPFAIYFPQFYSTDINDSAWGSGFSDWHLVSYANVRSSWSRRAPKRGFYNGSCSEVHLSQLEEMRQSGIGGVALYHYWFFDRHELSSMEQTLKGPENDTPWFVVWATESWSKRWIGSSEMILDLSKKPSQAMIDEHCDYLCSLFSCASYLKVDGKPLFVLYNLSHFDDASDVVYRYKEAFRQRGFDPYFGQFVKHPTDAGFAKLLDVSYLFEPRLFFNLSSKTRNIALYKIKDFFNGTLIGRVLEKLYDRFKGGRAYSSQSFLEYLRSEPRRTFVKGFSCDVSEVLNFGWNNTPRYAERYTSLAALTTEEAAEVIGAVDVGKYPVLINAWNEWSEGAAIEPCEYLGVRYLNAVSSSLK